MISICTVILANMEDYLSAFFQSICAKTQLVDEVVVVQVDSTEEGLIQAWSVRGIAFKLLGYPLGKHLGDAPNILLELGRHGCRDLNDANCALLALGGHALGLHHALDNAKNNHVLFSDPDVFFLNSVDSIYLKFMEELQLDIIGVEHPHWQNQAYLHFPCVINCLANKERLPNKEWLADQLYLRDIHTAEEDGECQPKPIIPLPGRFLMPSPLPDHYRKFPNPSGLYDVGVNLWLWANRWLSYSTEDGVSYSTSCHANFDLEPCTIMPLLCHQGDSAQKSGAAFRLLYERMK